MRQLVAWVDGDGGTWSQSKVAAGRSVGAKWSIWTVSVVDRPGDDQLVGSAGTVDLVGGDKGGPVGWLETATSWSRHGRGRSTRNGPHGPPHVRLLGNQLVRPPGPLDLEIDGEGDGRWGGAGDQSVRVGTAGPWDGG